MIRKVLPVSTVVATRNRSEIFRRTLESLAAQPAQPAELVVVDGSDDHQTEAVCQTMPTKLSSRMMYQKAKQLGAAVQRNQGVAIATHKVIWFHDDDILFDEECVARLWAGLQSAPELGGVNAMIVNQQYAPPGRITAAMLGLLNRSKCKNYPGRVIGPGINLLPADRPELPDVVPVEWLNTTCTMYRREALPDPPFPPIFSGYSLMEDLALSLTVGKKWKLANARTARIYHDSQPGDHKKNRVDLAEMELVNRHFVMTEVLGQRRACDYLRLGIWELFQVVAAGRNGPGHLASGIYGKLRGTFRLLSRLVE